MSGPELPHEMWLRKAAADELNIQNNLAAGEVPWDTVCFHAQQSVEKTLKAFLVSHGKTPDRTHDLVALLAACVEHSPGLATLENDCRRLTYYAVGGRYPDDLFEPGSAEGQVIIEAMKRVRTVLLAEFAGP